MNPLSITPIFFWTIIGFFVVVICLLVWVKFFFSDKNQINIARNKVRKYFDFLFNSGFEIAEIDYSPEANGAWSVVLKSEKYKLRIIQDRGDIYCEAVPIWAGDKKYLSISSIIANIENKGKNLYHPQTRKSINTQLEFYGKLLRFHFDKVTTYFENHSTPFANADKSN